ncbi:hypothetical protein [Paraburkholderia sp. DHOC27]|uniref:hypothetical protein n=1 Tax=Paraburkholderia sp. DHOC27 TaxID=2303330 RepID=UPI00286F2B72|nr:hypothetical protein [Paraburkholderia sp. DHOC27]
MSAVNAVRRVASAANAVNARPGSSKVNVASGVVLAVLEVSVVNGRPGSLRVNVVNAARRAASAQIAVNARLANSKVSVVNDVHQLASAQNAVNVHPGSLKANAVSGVVLRVLQASVVNGHRGSSRVNAANDVPLAALLAANAASAHRAAKVLPAHLVAVATPSVIAASGLPVFHATKARVGRRLAAHAAPTTRAAPAPHEPDARRMPARAASARRFGASATTLASEARLIGHASVLTVAPATSAVRSTGRGATTPRVVVLPVRATTALLRQNAAPSHAASARLPNR